MAAETGTDRRALRFGGALAMVGGLGYFTTLLAHGDLPDDTTAMALEHIAGRPEWPALKLLLIIFVLQWIGAFAALTESRTLGTARFFGRMALAFLIVGATIVVVQYSIMGYGLKHTADAWAVASGDEQEAAMHLAGSLLAATGGMFLSFITWLFGLPFVLMGYAVLRSNAYPGWTGWWAILAGAGAFATGVTRFLGLDLIPFPLLYGAFVAPLCFWLAIMGALMWRRAASLTREP